MEPAKPYEKKSDQTKKLNIQPGGNGPVKLPPLAATAATKGTGKAGGGLNETKNGAAYQVKKKNILVWHSSFYFLLYY